MDLSENYQVRRFRGAEHFRNLTTIKKSVGSEMTAQLTPFKPIMKRQLSKKGYDTKYLSFNDLIPIYYNEFVSNKNDKKNIFQPINAFEFSENPVFKFSENDNLNGDIFTHENRQYFNKVASVTDAIIDKFKKSKLKYQYEHIKGINNFDTALTNDEITQAKAAINIENKLKSKAEGNKPVTVKQLFIVILIFGLLIYMSK